MTEYTDNLIELIQLIKKDAVINAQTRGTAFALSVLDSLCADNYLNPNDKVLRTAKKTIRERFKAETGIDPAPVFPIPVESIELVKEDL